jgi:hypothetical protein
MILSGGTTGTSFNIKSFILKNGEFARFFLDVWFDPLYRNYNFAKAETHGLAVLGDDKVDVRFLLVRKRLDDTIWRDNGHILQHSWTFGLTRFTATTTLLRRRPMDW